MSCFTQVLNPITGQSEWEPQCDDYDYHQEVARSAFADMLHDTERNQKYFAAIKKAITKLHENGLKANVLDIGTGTGILSMMAVKCGADTITACEAFLPMANCAEKIIESNGMKDKIHLIKKRSTDIKISENDGDMKERANVLVTEVFDTELIGEGAIGIFNHAHEKLLTKDCIVIPHSSTVYCQLIESPQAIGWNKPKILANLDGDILLKTPNDIIKCKGECGVHDIQLNQLLIGEFRKIIEPIQIFQFDWSGSERIPKTESNDLKLCAIQTGTAQIVFFWWDLKFDKDQEIILSCAPYWAHPDFHELSKTQENPNLPIQNVIPWRDHWMQALYYLPNVLHLNKDEEFQLNSYHDEYSFWFDVRKSNETFMKIDRLQCTCDFHLAFPRTRIGQLNNNLRTKKYIHLLENIIDKNSKVLSLSDGSLLGLSTAAMGSAKTICLEPHKFSRNVLQSYIKENNLKNVQIIKNINEIDNDELKTITHVISEPYFVNSILPWDNLYFGTLLTSILPKLNENIKIIPQKADIYILPVEFIDLHKIRTPLGICEGFDLTVFDKFVENSTKLADANIEAQPLWEYPCKALGKEQSILTINFENFSESKTRSGVLPIECSGSCNGIALWIDWNLDGNVTNKYVVTTGPTQQIELGKYIKWDMFNRQGVQLFSFPKSVTTENSIKWNVNFVPKNGNISFKFDVV